jgi:TrpR-related protein YerC/YecD
MNDKIYSEHMNELFKAVLALKNETECYAFFEDLCTVTELKALAQRFQVAQMLKAGCQYTEIVEKTGASTATISRVNRSLLYGADGYKTMLERLEKKDG